MTQAIVVIICLLLIAGFVVFKKWFDKKTEWMQEIIGCFVGKGIDDAYWKHKYEYTTPSGLTMRSPHPIPPNAQAEIERGIANQIRLYSEQNPLWRAGRNLSEYFVYVIKQMTVNQDGSPAIYVNGIQSAGTMLGHSEHYEALDLKPVVVIASQHEQNWQYLEYLRHSAFAESEHLREWLNRNLEPTGIFYYWANANDVHPHCTAGWGDEIRGLKAPAPISCALGEVKQV